MSDRILDTIASPIRECWGPDSPHEHVAMRIIAALKANRIALVELPEPDDDHGDGIAFWTAQEVGVADGMVVARFDPGNEAIYYEPSEAWEMVAALAAAAVVAEGER